MATAPPAPMPPEVAEQASPEGAQSVFTAQGVGTPQPEMAVIQQAEQILKGEIEAGFDHLVTILRQVQPALLATLQPAAQAFVMLRKQMKDLAQRSGAAMGSPVMPQTPPANPGAAPPNPSAM